MGISEEGLLSNPQLSLGASALSAGLIIFVPGAPPRISVPGSLLNQHTFTLLPW
jgi:hypothetical protein